MIMRQQGKSEATIQYIVDNPDEKIALIVKYRSNAERTLSAVRFCGGTTDNVTIIANDDKARMETIKFDLKRSRLRYWDVPLHPPSFSIDPPTLPGPSDIIYELFRFRLNDNGDLEGPIEEYLQKVFEGWR